MSTRQKSGIVSITIPEDQWELIGFDDDDNENASRLLAIIKINGAYFHLEAVEVRAGKPIHPHANIDVEFPTQEYVDAPDWIQVAIDASSDGDTVQTITIKGREYVLIATPYQQ